MEFAPLLAIVPWRCAITRCPVRAGRREPDGLPGHGAGRLTVSQLGFVPAVKSDAIDARELSRYGEERHARLPRWQPPAVEREKLRALVEARAVHVRRRAGDISWTIWRRRFAWTGEGSGLRPDTPRGGSASTTYAKGSGPWNPLMGLFSGEGQPRPINRPCWPSPENKPN
jgi:hypothetical protein